MGVAVSSAMVPAFAFAGDLSVTTATTTPVLTSNADGAGAGDVDITTSGSITVSAGETAVTIDSDNSLTNAGAINALELNGGGVAVSADMTGGIDNDGGITTGAAETDTVNVVQGAPAILVNEDIDLGITNSGTIVTYGNVGILIDAATNNIVLGTSPDTGSLFNDGVIASYAYASSTGGTKAISIMGTGFTATLTDGIINDSGASIAAYGYDQDATSIEVGNGGVVSLLNNSGSIIAYTYDDQGVGGTAIGVDVAAGGSLSSLDNSGTITATAAAAGTDAIAIRDMSGTLTSIVNSGTISAAATSTGSATAIDLSSSGAIVDIDNSGTITGDMLFGAGTYSLDSTDGSIFSAFTVDGGALTLSLSGGTVASVSSTLASGGTLALDVDDAIFYVPEGEVFNATSASFGTDSTFYTIYDPVNGTGSGYVSTTGATTFDSGATIDVNFSSYLANNASLLVAEGGSVTDSGAQIGGVSAGYNATLNQIGNQLFLDLARKTAAELGYTGYLAGIYNAAPTALEFDDALGIAIGGIDTVGGLQAAYEQLLPDLTGARERGAVMAQTTSSDAIDSRLSVLRGTTKARNRRRGYGVGWWGRQSFSSITRDGARATGYDGDLFGLTIGYDRSEGNNGGGIAFTYTAGSYGGAMTGPDDSSITSVGLQLYKFHQSGQAYWNLMGGAALNSYDTERRIAVGAVNYQAESDSLGYQGMVGAGAGYLMDLGGLTLTPSLRGDYTYLLMDSYEESGAGGANLDIDSGDFQSLRAKAALRASYATGRNNAFEPYLEGGYTAELLAEDTTVEGRFHSGGSFSLTGEQANESAPFVNAGIIIRMAGGSISAGYEGEFGSDIESHRVAVMASLQF
ncbi:MAG: autotransporter domain-containing protein [Parvibaculum sp.]|nr:autotransporter domain-containing protein [Parvibaculum sp.]